jgi:hypothetical protein
MRLIFATALAAVFLAGPALAQPAASSGGSQIACSQIPDAQRFIDGLKPGPNTRAAQQHLDAAKRASDAGNDRQCVSELTRVNYYATRSANADKRAGTHHAAARHAAPRRVQCADPLHQNRPGGTDYHGPAVPGCPRPAL